MKRLPLLFLSLSCLCLCFSCGGGGSTPRTSVSTNESGQAADESRGTIGFSALSLKNPFFKIISDQLVTDAEEAGFKVIVVDGNDDVSNQSNQVDTFIAQRVTAIVLNPKDGNAIIPAVKKANAAGIPVFTCDLPIAEGSDANVVAHVGTDNYAGGHLAGQAMIEAVGELGGEILVLHYKTATSCIDRVNGFTDEIDEYNAEHMEGKFQIVAELDGGGSQDVGYKATLDAVQQHPNLVGIFAINDPSALGAVTALEQSGKADQIKVVGFDGQLEGKQAIKEGKIYADPIQFPEQMATMTVENIVKYLDGEEFDKVHLIETKLYRKADAAQDPDLQ